jgi:membrane-associated phospholipid phosphatase
MFRESFPKGVTVDNSCTKNELNLFFNFKELNMKKAVVVIITAFIAGFQTLCYYLVNQICSTFPASSLYSLNTVVDDIIPYMGFTWIIYYSGDLFMLIWAFVVILMLDKNKFKRAILIYIIMIITGAVIQILIPAVSPYPAELTGVQAWLHKSVIDAQYACFPSMHVALCIFPACIGMTAFKSLPLKIFPLVYAVLISISTLTLKEHYFLDLLGGVALALLFFFFWHYNLNDLMKRVVK